MAKPYIHAKSSAKKFGGDIEDYVGIHQYMDSSKSHCAMNTHRAIFHHSFGIFIMENMFGIDFEALDSLAAKHNLSEEAKEDILKWKNKCTEHGKNIKNANGKQVSVRDVGEQHILEDFRGKFIPSASDYLAELNLTEWMNGVHGMPNSCKNQSNLKRKVV